MSLRVALLALSLVGILAIGTGIEIFKLGDRSAQHQADLERSIKQRSAIRRLATALQEAEAMQRGYLLTRNPAYETLFRSVEREILAAFEQLPRSFADAGAQPARVRDLVALGREQLADLAAEFEELKASGRTAREILEARGVPDLRKIARMRELIDQTVAFEAKEIQVASLLLDEQLRWSRTVVIVLLGSIVLLVSSVLGGGVMYLSHRGRIELRLQEATQVAEKASRAKSEFLASMSHEIRTPLTGILGYTELLLGEKLTGRQREFVERLQTSSAGLLALVNDILDFSKIEAGDLVLEREPLSLRALIADVMSIVSVEARRKGLQLIQEVDPAVPERLLGDALRLRQVLLNLLGNAVKFTEKGSTTLRASHAGTSPAGELIRLEVRDTGIGIPTDQQQRLFQRFSQVDRSIQRRYGGSGLGLAISKRLVELMGGEIGVESTEGRGSTFWFVVPLARTEDNVPATTAESDAPRVSGRRILLAEDSPQNQDLVATILHRAGHRVDIAANGGEALAALQGASYDLILMDMQMPGMDGLSATRRIRESGRPERDVPIIAMTANVLPEHLQQFREAGANDHIAKPFRIKQLLATVDRWLVPDQATGDRPAPEPVAPPTHDPAVLQDARDLMGEQWVGSCLARLEGNITRLFLGEVAAPPDVASLKRLAHQIVGDAGQLGFTELSRRCSALEEACTQGGDIDRAFEQARQAGRLAVAAIEALLSDAGER